MKELFESIQAGRIEQVKALLRTTPGLANARDPNGMSAVTASLYSMQAEIVELLISTGATLDIFEACAAGRIDRVQALLAVNSGGVNSFSGDGFTPLHLSAFFNQPAVVDLLLGRGADVNAVSRNRVFARGSRPIHSAVARGLPSIVKRLIDGGADVDAVDDDGGAPLFNAAFGGHAEIVSILLAAGADAGLRNRQGRSPLEVAKEKRHAAVVDLLERRR